MTAMRKEEAKALVDQLPDDATWEDLVYAIEFRRAVESGRDDAREGRTLSVAEVRQSLGLKA